MLKISLKLLVWPQFISLKKHKRIGMKKAILLFLLIIFSQTASSQFRLFGSKGKDPIINRENMDKALFSWGYYLGFNQYDFKFDYRENQGDIQVAKSVGFNVGLVGELRLNDHFDLRLEPGLYFTKRDLGFPDNAAFDSPGDRLREVKSTYIHVPLLLKISTKRLDNIKPFIVAGLSTSLNLSSNEKNPDDNSNGTFRMKRNTYYYELGFGIDLYLFYFKFTPSIRGVFALSDELMPDVDPNSPWTSNIAKMQSRGVFINFTFE